MTASLNPSFDLALLAWYDKHGRKNLPWQHPRSAYRVWISEIMLQQTQVQTVVPYFERFMSVFPDLDSLAKAEEDEVLALWSGLGYYSRARNILKTAKIIVETFNGVFPHNLTELCSLPGIGESTAAAIASQAFNLPAAILDGNVKRVLSRYFMVDGIPGQTAVNKKLWNLAKQCMPEIRCADYTQAIMDLGATLCTRTKPSCSLCPLQTRCMANQQQAVSQYPFKKLKKVLPVQHQQFLLLHKDNEIYLERRAPVGLWGGLWCLPTIDKDIDPISFVRQQYGWECSTSKNLSELKHSFSHFHLHISAVALNIQDLPLRMAEGPGDWFKEGQLERLGLAKPVSKIIQCFRANREIT